MNTESTNLSGVVNIDFTIDVAHGVVVDHMEVVKPAPDYITHLCKREYRNIVSGLIQTRKLGTGSHSYDIRIDVDMMGSSMKMSAWPHGEDEPVWKTQE